MTSVYVHASGSAGEGSGGTPRAVFDRVARGRRVTRRADRERAARLQARTDRAAGGWRDRRRLGWVDCDGRALAVRVDEPAGPTVGALVVAPPVGREAVVAIRTTAALALAAADAGFVAFTYSPSGEGDSADPHPQDDLARVWARDLAAVVAQARAHVGPDAPVHVVGLRLGACLLEALPDSGPGARVAWEPVSGRSFLRQHGLVRRDSVDVPVAPAGTELEGVRYTAAQAASLARLRAPRRGPGVVRERDRRAALRIAMGAPYFAHVPTDSIARIVAGLDRGAPRPTRAWEGPSQAEFTSADGVRVTERRVLLDGLPAIVTTCPQVPARVGMTFTAMGSEVKAGPGRLWVDAARRLAPHGVVAVRADRHLTGDDTGPDQIEEPRPYTDACVADVAAPARRLRLQGLPVVGVGVCAGAWALLRAAQDGMFDEVVAVNPVHWNPREDVYDEAFYRHYHGGDSAPVDARPAAEPATAASSETQGPTPARAAAVAGRAVDALLRTAEEHRPGTREQLHALARHASKELAIRHPRLRSALRRDVPLDLVSMLLSPLRPPLRVTLLFGAEEFRIFRGKGGRRAASAARHRGVDVRVGHDPVLDHSLFSQAGRDRVLELLLTRFGSSPVAEPSTFAEHGWRRRGGLVRIHESRDQTSVQVA